MIYWIVGIAAAAVLVIILINLDREIWTNDGRNLGPRIQSWLYDKWAGKYDADKAASQANDADNLALPLIERMAGQADGTAPDGPSTAAAMLDIAAGTGRLSYAMLSQAGFRGSIIAIDISQEMLAKAAAKVAPYGDRITLMRASGLALPFPDASFDVVGCIEVAEIMPSLPFREIARVLRPGGVLISTHALPASTLNKWVMSQDAFKAALTEAGFEQIEIFPFWASFDRVFARLAGSSQWIAPRPVMDILQCPSCKQVKLAKAGSDALKCGNCGAAVPVTAQGIVMMPI